MNTLDLSVKGHLGLGVQTDLTLVEGQRVTFVLRIVPEHTGDGVSKTQQAEASRASFESEHFQSPHIRLMVMTCRVHGGYKQVTAEGRSDVNQGLICCCYGI